MSGVPLNNGLKRLCLFTLFTWSAFGCSRVKVNVELDTPTEFQELKESSQSLSTTSSYVSTDDPWWRSLDDPSLSGLVEGMFSSNLQLAQARERVIQMRAVATQAGSQRWPSLSLELGWSRTKQLNPFSRLSTGGGSAAMSTAGMGPPSSGLPSSFTQDNFRTSLAVSYEVDVWGRIGSLTEAAERDAVASVADLKSMAITLSANAVDIYLQLIESQRRLMIIKNQLLDDEDQLKIVINRFNQGLSQQIEVLQQTQQRDQTHAQIPPLYALLSTLKRRMAALRGEPRLAETLNVPDRLPKRPALPSLGLPVSVLESRPDIRAAYARLSAADARVSAAVSARLPALRLGTSAGYQSFEFNELFDDSIWSLTGNLITPLFQGGRLKAEQTRVEAILRERLLALRERFIIAYHEVENALSDEKSAAEQLIRIKAQLRSAEALFDSAQRRYLTGVGDFLTTLTARKGLYASQLASLSAERSALSARVQLHRALGGGWVDRLTEAVGESDLTR